MVLTRVFTEISPAEARFKRGVSDKRLRGLWILKSTFLHQGLPHFQGVPYFFVVSKKSSTLYDFRYVSFGRHWSHPFLICLFVYFWSPSPDTFDKVNRFTLHRPLISPVFLVVLSLKSRTLDWRLPPSYRPCRVYWRARLGVVSVEWV